MHSQQHLDNDDNDFYQAHEQGSPLSSIYVSYEAFHNAEANIVGPALLVVQLLTLYHAKELVRL